MTIDAYLSAIKAAHRQRVGTFCYVATPSENSMKVWQLSVVEKGVGGHFPIDGDYAPCGEERFMMDMAERLNRQRLDILPRETAIIVASSMQGNAR